MRFDLNDYSIPHTFTDEVMDLLGGSLAQRIEVTTVEPLPTLNGDDRMLRFALLNLLDNACKYSPPESPVRVHIQAAEDGVVWRVADEGRGIPPGMEEKIFDKYVRAGEVSGKAGLGLGLYLARHIVERHGGTIKAGAGRTQGACFVYWLPIESSQ